MRYGKNFIVQCVVKQHKILNDIHPNSVNTIRVITILIKNKVNVLSSCLRMGCRGSRVDNISSSGVSCGILGDGRLRSVGYDLNGNKVFQHPDGYKFDDCVVPGYDLIIKDIEKAAIRVPQFGVVSWDFAVNEEGTPVLSINRI